MSAPAGPAVILLVSVVQGFISMGYQILGSRLLYPYFGSTVIVWAFLISTFLLGFCVGAFYGGYLVRHAGQRLDARLILGLGVPALLSFAFTTFCAVPIMEALVDRIDGLAPAVMIASLLFFFLPVATISSLSPILTQLLSRRQVSAGAASGIVYGSSTIGNVLGIMATTFVLIPNLPVSQIFVVWLIAVCGLFGSLLLLRD